MPQGTLKKVVRTYQEVDVSPVSPSSTIQGCEGEWSAFDPLPKLTQASDKDVRIIIGKERESYEPELNYTAYKGEWSHPCLTSSKPKGIRQANPFWFIQNSTIFRFNDLV